jgi:hypothetical protein
MADQRSRDLPIATPAPVPGHRQAFGRLLESLNDEDIKRISIQN